MPGFPPPWSTETRMQLSRGKDFPLWRCPLLSFQRTWILGEFLFWFRCLKLPGMNLSLPAQKNKQRKTNSLFPRVLQRRKSLDAWRWIAALWGSQGNLCISITPEQWAIEKWAWKNPAHDLGLFRKSLLTKRFLSQQKDSCEARQYIIWPKSRV